MKKILALVLILTLLFSQAVLVLGNDRYTREADVLNKLGLFAGTNNGYELDKLCDRIQGAVLFSRIIGKEAEAIKYKGSNTFIDVPDWAVPYISYLHANGYVQGMSATVYGAGSMTANAYATFLLRALGYRDDIDFIWSAAVATLHELKILTDQDVVNISSAQFTRDFAVNLSYRVLSAKLRSSDKTLLQNLIASGAISRENVLKTNDSVLISLLTSDNNTVTNGDTENKGGKLASSPSSMKYATGTALNGIVKLAPPPDDLNPPTETITSISELVSRIAYLNANCPGGKYKINLSNISIKNDFTKLNSAIVDNDSIFGSIDSFLYNFTGDKITSVTVTVNKTFHYELAKAFTDESYINTTENEAAKKVYPIVKDILQKYIKPNMTDYEKEKAIHDFMVSNFCYETKNPLPDSAYTIDGLLLNKTGVCEAYANTFMTFMNLMGIQCIAQEGAGKASDHLWNIIMLDGDWYNVDVTWDDPLPDEPGRVMYTFFNVTDTFLKGTHKWTPQPNVAATATKYGYKNVE